MNNACAVAGPSDKLVKLIATFEGFRAEAYKCAAGKDTIGYGHLIGDDEAELLGASLTEEEALELLRKDIAERTSLGAIGVELELHQQDALTSLCFNIGTACFAGADVVKRINAGDLIEAREYLGHWRRGAGAVLPGLCMRRLAEVCVFAHAPVDPESSDPPSVQWGIAEMAITDDNWARMSVELRRQALAIYEEYWKE